MIPAARILVLLVVTLLVTASSTAAPPPSALAKARQQLSAARDRIANLESETTAQNDLLAAQADTITRLRNRATPDPVDQILARDPDAIWSAMIQVWQGFPRLPDSQVCGFDKSQTSGGSDGLVLTTFVFSKWSGCE